MHGRFSGSFPGLTFGGSDDIVSDMGLGSVLCYDNIYEVGDRSHGLRNIGGWMRRILGIFVVLTCCVVSTVLEWLGGGWSGGDSVMSQDIGDSSGCLGGDTSGRIGA